jgi:hypothetical protein
VAKVREGLNEERMMKNAGKDYMKEEKEGRTGSQQGREVIGHETMEGNVEGRKEGRKKHRRE